MGNKSEGKVSETEFEFCFGKELSEGEKCEETDEYKDFIRTRISPTQQSKPAQPKNRNVSSGSGGLDFGGLFGGGGRENNSDKNSKNNPGLVPFETASFAPTAPPVAAPVTGLKTEIKPDTKSAPLSPEIKAGIRDFGKKDNATVTTPPTLTEAKIEKTKAMTPAATEAPPKVEIKSEPKSEVKTASAIIPKIESKPETAKPKVEEGKIVFAKCEENIHAGAVGFPGGKLISIGNVGKLKVKKIQNGSVNFFSSKNYRNNKCLHKDEINFMHIQDFSGQKFVMLFLDSNLGKLPSIGQCTIYNPNSLVKINNMTGYYLDNCDPSSYWGNKTYGDALQEVRNVLGDSIFAVKQNVMIEKP